MRIWLLKTGEPLPTESSQVRLLRMGILAEELVRKGHEVVWWTSTFDHRRKCQRYKTTQHLQIEKRYRLIAIKSPGYTKNISLRRIMDHRIVAHNFLRQAPTQPRPDVILSALPTLELSLAATRYATQNNVPVVIDIRDMWPDVFERALPRIGRKPARALIQYFSHMATTICSQATAITGHAPDFVEWGLEKAGRVATPLDRHFPFAYRQQPIDEESLQEANQFWRSFGLAKEPGKPIITFVGTLGHQFEISPVIEAARKLADCSQVRFVLCGDGESRTKLMQESKDCQSVHWPGWIDAPKIQAILQMSSLALAPYRDTPDFAMSIPNKVIEYLATGTPVLTSLERSVMHDLLGSRNCGASYGNSGEQLAATIKHLLSSDKQIQQMSEAATDLFREQFAAENVYGEMADSLARIAQQFGSEAPLKKAA